MPIVLNRAGPPRFDAAALQQQIDARSLQAAQNAAEIESRGMQALAQGIGRGAELYSRGRERIAERDDNALKTAQTNAAQTLAQIRDDERAVQQQGMEHSPKRKQRLAELESDYLDLQSNKYKLRPRARAQALNVWAAERAQLLPDKTMPLPKGPEGYDIAKVGTNFQLVKNEAYWQAKEERKQLQKDLDGAKKAYRDSLAKSKDKRYGFEGQDAFAADADSHLRTIADLEARLRGDAQPQSPVAQLQPGNAGEDFTTSFAQATPNDLGIGTGFGTDYGALTNDALAYAPEAIEPPAPPGYPMPPGASGPTTNWTQRPDFMTAMGTNPATWDRQYTPPPAAMPSALSSQTPEIPAEGAAVSSTIPVANGISFPEFREVDWLPGSRTGFGRTKNGITYEFAISPDGERRYQRSDKAWPERKADPSQAAVDRRLAIAKAESESPELQKLKESKQREKDDEKVLTLATSLMSNGWPDPNQIDPETKKPKRIYPQNEQEAVAKARQLLAATKGQIAATVTDTGPPRPNLVALRDAQAIVDLYGPTQEAYDKAWGFNKPPALKASQANALTSAREILAREQSRKLARDEWEQSQGQQPAGTPESAAPAAPTADASTAERAEPVPSTPAATPVPATRSHIASLRKRVVSDKEASGALDIIERLGSLGYANLRDDQKDLFVQATRALAAKGYALQPPKRTAPQSPANEPIQWGVQP